MNLYSVVINLFFSNTITYLSIYLIYWFVFCVPLSALYLKGNKISDLFTVKTKSKFSLIYCLIAFLPCILSFFAVFTNTVSKAPWQAFLLALLFAVINSLVEEVYWRGVFVKIYDKNILLSYILPTVVFSLWHSSLYFSKNINYEGGIPALVGSALIMGAAWGFSAFKLKSIKYTVISHFLANFFAFSGLIYETWFK